MNGGLLKGTHYFIDGGSGERKGGGMKRRGRRKKKKGRCQCSRSVKQETAKKGREKARKLCSKTYGKDMKAKIKKMWKKYVK